jgi:hypothetical protein
MSPRDPLARDYTTPFLTDSPSLTDRLSDAIAYLDDRLADAEERLARDLELGKMQHVLDAAARTIAGLEDELDVWRLRFEIAIDERIRAESRIGELEGLLDAAPSGIDITRPARWVRTPPTPIHVADLIGVTVPRPPHLRSVSELVRSPQ